MKLPVKCKAVTLLGIGTVGSGIVQLFPQFIDCQTLHIVDRVKDLSERVGRLVDTSLPEVREKLSKITLVCHVEEINSKNYRTILEPLLRESQAVMDLTTVVDSETIARLADENDCVYINACLEVFAEDTDLSEGKRHEHFRKIKDSFRNTMVLEIGMNPGLISLLFNRAMRDSGFTPQEVHTVHVTEYDTHRLKESAKKENVFYNTWSAFGLWEEGVKNAEMAWATSNSPAASAGWKAEGALRKHETARGIELCLQSVTPKWKSPTEWTWGPYYGFVITHGEVETISHKLHHNINAAFVFHTCPDGTESLRKWPNEHAPSYQMMLGSDMVNTATHVSADNIGALVLTKDGRGWWTGSLMQSVEAQRVGGVMNNGANITVSAGCLAAICWALTNPMKGCHFPDDIDPLGSEAILQACEPFLGTLVSSAVPRELLPQLKPHFLHVQPGHLPPDPSQ